MSGRHLFERLRKDGTWATVYVDIFATSNLREFTAQFAASVIGSMDSRIDRAIVAAARFFKSFRPEVSVDAATGSPTVSFGIAPRNVEVTLKECFDYLREKGECVVAIDEFQQIGAYPESGVEALLRSYVQFLPDTRFIFAGSRHRLMYDVHVGAFAQGAVKRPSFAQETTLRRAALRR